MLFLSEGVNAQLSGIKTIPGDYATIALAVSDLNAQGVGGGGVTFNVAAGHTESSALQITLTATGTVANPILFQKSGAGANPLITRSDAGANITSTLGGLGDAVFQINGSDYLTIDGIDVTASNSGIEYGYITHKPSGTDGCQVVTIKNSAVTMTKGASAYVTGIYISNGPTSLSSAAGVTVTANSGTNNSILLTGNTISNVHTGIHMRGSTAANFSDQNPVVGQSGAGNIIQNFGGGSVTTTYGVYLLYQVNPVIEYNSIDNAGGGGSAHASTLYGIFFTTGVSGNIVANNNTITMNSSGTSAVQWIYNGILVSSIDISYNTFSGTIAATTTSHLIYNSSSTVGLITISNNQTSGTINKTGSSGTFYGYYNFGSPGSGTENISANTFSNISLNGSSVFTAINSNTSAGHTHNIFNNTISNITGTHTGATIGINAASANTRNIYGNTIFNISSAGAVTGISNGTGGATALNIYKNKIYELNTNSTATTTGLVSGIAITSGTTNSVANVFNNLVGNLTAPTAASTDAIRGINITSTISTSSIALSFNTIYLAASSSGANFGTSGVYHTTSATATTATLDMRNNIIVNLSTASGSGVNAAYRRSSTTLTNFSSASNNNLLYAGTPSASKLIFYDGTNSDQNLVDYVSRVTPRELLSISEPPSFLSTTGSSANFLHIDTAVPTNIESGAAPIGGITDDFDGNTRNVTTPDIGADEFSGSTPTCSGTPAASNTLISLTPPVCNGAIFTLSLSQAYTAVEYQWQSSPDNMTWSNIPGATFDTYVTSTSTQTYYRAVITCPASMLSTNSTSVNVTVVASLIGVYTIDNTLPTAGANYNNFVDAITALNCRGISGDVTFNVTSGQTFASSDSLNITATGTSTDTIAFNKSGGGANPKVERLGNSAVTNYILRIGGGDYITFNGIDFGQTGSMASNYVEYGIYIQNGSTTNGAQYNTFKNGVITISKSNAASKGVYVLSSFTPTAASGTNSNNRFLNMTVSESYEGYRINGATTTFPDDGNEINTQGGGISSISTLGDGTATGTMYGAIGVYQTNFKIANTEITNLTPGGTSLAYGIALNTSTANTAVFADNNINTLAAGGSVYGISIGAGDSVNIYNNRIFSLSTTGSASAVRGIDASGTGLGMNIYKNRIYALSSSGVTGTTVGGIDVASGTVFNISNNMISGLTAGASTSTTGGTKGITTSGSTAGQIVRVYYNTVLLTDIGAVAGYTSAGFYNSSSVPVIDFRNNVIVNTSDVTTGTRAAAYWKNNTTINQAATTNNNLYYGGTPGTKNLLYYDGTNAAQTLAAIQAIAGMSPREGLSVTENVDFDAVTNGIIRPDIMTMTLIESSGAEITDYTTDFENNARGPYPVGGQMNGGGIAPDLGADEGDYLYIAPPVPDCATLTAPANMAADLCLYEGITLTWTPALTGGLATGGFDVYFGTSATPPFLLNTSATSYTPTGLLANTTYYWKIVPKNASGNATGCVTYSFSTINVELISTTPGSRCGTGSVALGASGNGTLNWYANSTGGNALGSGTTFNTPVINTTTDFYVSASGGPPSGSVGAPNAGNTGTYTLEAGLLFNVLASSMVLGGVYIYPIGTGAGTVNIALKNSGGSTLQSLAFNCTGTTSPGVKTYVPLNWTIPAGTDYFLDMTSRTGSVASLIRDASADIVGGPIASNPAMTLPGIVTITSGRLGASGTSTSYYFFYDWVINPSCETPRTAVTATVTPAEPIIIAPGSITRCELEPATSISATSTYAYGTYTWSPSTGLNTPTGPTVLANPASTTTYTVTGDDGTCANTASIVVSVNPAPLNPMASATPNPVCEGAIVNLSSSAEVPGYALNTNCSTSFVDISGSGTSVPDALGDDTEHNITIPAFTFNGVSYTTARVGMNGVIALSSTTGEISTANAALPSTANSAGNILLLPYWDDLDIQTSPTIKTQTIGNVFIIQFTNLAHNNYTTGSITFQVQLNLTTGVITYVYQDVVFGDPLYDNGISATIGIQYSGTSALQYSFNTASLSNGQCISFSPNSVLYSWSGPGGFTSFLQNPTLGMVDPADAGLYTATFEGSNGCENTASVTLVVNTAPTITPGSNPSVCSGILSVDLPYSGTTGSPDEYSINFDMAAETAGFADIINAPLPVSPISIVVPGAAPTGIYNATLTVRNNASTCTSSMLPITVTVLGLPNAGTVSGLTPLCVAATATYGSSGDLGGVWTSTNPSVASVNAMTGLVTALTAGTTDITYTSSNACGSPAMAFQSLTVDPIEVLNTNDAGPGSLREIISCAGPGAVITFGPALMSQTIALTSGEIVIDKYITLSGIGMMNLSISGSNLSSIFHVLPGDTLRIEDMALINASAMTNGGALFVEGTLILENVLLDNNLENGVPKSLTIVNPAMLEVIGTVEMKD